MLTTEGPLIIFVLGGKERDSSDREGKKSWRRGKAFITNGWWKWNYFIWEWRTWITLVFPAPQVLSWAGVSLATLLGFGLLCSDEQGMILGWRWRPLQSITSVWPGKILSSWPLLTTYFSLIMMKIMTKITTQNVKCGGNWATAFFIQSELSFGRGSLQKVRSLLKSQFQVVVVFMLEFFLWPQSGITNTGWKVNDSLYFQ